MKRRMLSLVLILALLVNTGAFSVQAVDGGQGNYQMCEHEVADTEWSAWDCTGGNPAEGHFYLADTFTEQTEMVTVDYGRDVCLDLRGNTWITEGIRTLNVVGTLSVMDSVGGGMILVTGQDGSSGAFATVASTGTLNIYGGTIRQIAKDDVNIRGGGLVRVDGGTLNISGGTLAGGTVRSTDSAVAQGGNIYVTGSGTVNISGGTVTGGMARMAGSQVAQGGNIYALSNATVNITGGTVTDGYSDQNGGNIYIGGATLTVSGGTVQNGHALISGGNICQQSGNANSVTVSGGYITGGVAGGTPHYDASSTSAKGSGGGGNYFGSAAKGSLTVSGGMVDGDMKLDSMSAVTLSGAPKIGLGKSNGLHINNTAIKADVSGLTEGAEIFVNAGGVFTQDLTDAATAEAVMGYFKEAVRMTLSVEGSAIKGSNGVSVMTGYCPHCYDPENPQKVTWIRDWSSIKSGMADSHVFLRYYSASAKTIPANVVLDLSGMTVRRVDRMMITVSPGCCLSVLDSYGGGTIQGSGSVTESSPSWGGVVYVGKGSTLELYSGSLDMENPNGSYVYAGGVISAPTDGAKVNLYGGIVRDGVLSSKYSNYSYLPGGNIALTYANSVFTMTGGVVIGGTAPELTVSETAYPGYGGNIYAAGSVNISGGFILDGTASGNGGNLRSGNAMHISGGVIADGTAANGGNIYTKVAVSGSEILSGGTVVGGTAEQGGNLYIAANSTGRTIAGGTVVGGTAEQGGNIYQGGDSSVNDGSLTISGGAILSGKASDGGNIYFTYSQLNIREDGLVAGGRADSMGGNVFAGTAATANISGGLVLAGYSASRGGSIYSAATNNHIHVTGGKISDGRADSMGGNIYINNGFLDVTGGVIEGGSAQSGGNITLHMGYGANPQYCGKAIFDDDGDSATPLAQITGGQAEKLGGNIYFAAVGNADGVGTNTMVLGNCVIEEGQAGVAGSDLYVNTKAYLQVLPGFAQNLTVYFHEELLSEGKLDDAYITCEGVYIGKLYLENEERRPQLYTSENDSALYVATTALVYKDGSTVWYTDNGAAVENYDSTVRYLLPMGGELELQGGVYMVDLAGQTLNITGTGTLACFDSGNDGYITCGSATIAEGITLVNDPEILVDGNTYIALESEGVYSFHRLDMRVTGVSIRPGSAGIYYTCAWNCDDTLKANLRSYGVALSLVDMPGTEFDADADTLYTQQDAAALVSGQTGTSVLIENILATDAEDNSERGMEGIYAAPYVVFNDGTETGKNLVSTAEVKYSLCDVMQLLDQKAYYSNKIALENFYNSWTDAMKDWGFENIGVKPSDDTTLKLLMVGNSFCYYYVEELYALLAESLPQGITDVEVYNLYYSGCSVQQHYSWWQAGTAKYDLYRTDREGRKQLGEKQGWTLEAALAQGNWDYISLQNSSMSYLADDMDALLQQEIYPNAGPLLNRFHEQFPYTKLLWHRTWAYEVNRVYQDTVYTEELLVQYDQNMQYICEKVCEEYKDLGLTMVDTGNAWAKARELAAGTELIPTGGLCARLGYSKYITDVAHSGDGYHDGDIGGGQLLNAYVWYMTITGDTDLTDSTYVPTYKYGSQTYTLSDAFIAVLKEAAMSIAQ